MEEERKKLLFVFVFSTYLLCFYSNFDQESLLDAEFDSASNEYPHWILFMGPATPKKKKYLKKCDVYFFGYRGLSKIYIVGTCWMRNQILHPTSSPDWNLSKKTGRYVENTNTKSSFFLFPPKLINIILLFNYYFIILTIILLFSLGGPF